MKKINWRELGIDLAVDVAASIIIAVGIYNFAMSANFPVAGFSGIAIIMYHLLYTGGCGDDSVKYTGSYLLL